MRAVLLRRFGPPEVLEVVEVADPIVGPGQALVEVEMASVTFVETQVRAGRPPNPAMTPKLPIIPGNGVGGRVGAVGTDVDPAVVGRQVVSTTGGSGGYAQRAVVEADGLIAVPGGVELAQAVALLADGRTAVALMRAVRLRPAETVLVEAAAGGVGSLLVQLARNAGAHVIAAAGGQRKLDLARELGADVCVDYTQPGWAEQIDGVDVAFDGVGGAIGRAAFDLVRRGGRFCSFGMASGAFTSFSEEEAAQRQVQVVRIAPPGRREMADLSRTALDEAAAGRLRAVIGQIFPLEHAAEAHAHIEARATIGKTLLRASSS